MAFDCNKCKLLRVTYRKSTAIIHVCNMYQENAIFDNISSAFALLGEKHLRFSVPNT